jgi:DNA-binding IscR family transcriptional regulator
MATGREIAEAINITGRVARRIIVDLDTAGYITKKKEGRGTGMF